MKGTIIESALIGALSGGWMESTYWKGNGLFCGIVIGLIAWALIAGYRYGK